MPFFLQNCSLPAVIVRCVLCWVPREYLIQAWHPQKMKLKYQSANNCWLGVESTKYHQIHTRPLLPSDLNPIKISCLFKYQYNSFHSYVFHVKLADLISFHSWVIHFTVGGPAEVVVVVFFFFFLFLSIVLIKTNWIELMVPRPQITALPSQSCSSLKWDKSSVLCNQTSTKSQPVKEAGSLVCCYCHGRIIAFPSRSQIITWHERAQGDLFEHKEMRLPSMWQWLF